MSQNYFLYIRGTRQKERRKSKSILQVRVAHRAEPQHRGGVETAWFQMWLLWGGVAMNPSLSGVWTKSFLWDNFRSDRVIALWSLLPPYSIPLFSLGWSLALNAQKKVGCGARNKEPKKRCWACLLRTAVWYIGGWVGPGGMVGRVLFWGVKRAWPRKEWRVVI